MSKPSSRRIPFHAYFLAALCFSNTAIALQEVKRILLSELGTHVGGLGGGYGGGGYGGGGYGGGGDGGTGNWLDQSRSC